MTSLRGRIIVGSILWTVGMVVLASAAFSVLMERSEGARMATVMHVHGTLQAPIVLSLAVLCLVVGARQVRRGVRRIDDLRANLAELHHGHGHALEGEYPAEVQPLVNELNALLAHRDEAVRRAVNKAGDLAHGLKTPLAVLARDAECARAAGQGQLADSMQQQIGRMQRQIDYHLAHARAAASGATAGTRTAVADSADGLARAMERIHAARTIDVRVECDSAHHVRVGRADLDEMLGNLLDNACKWARTRVTVASARSGTDLVVTVDDDGPGIEKALRTAVLGRGVRADEVTPGNGLGLAIVRDLSELYGGSVGLEEAPGGGCRAVLRLPAARTS